jgi:putative DNA methylase
MKKKLIEVSLPLEVINKQSAREKSIRHGHPSTLHLWWSRKPLATCRAVLFASMVDDPGDGPGSDEERERLHKIIERLVDWDNLKNDKAVYAEAHREILRCAPPEGLPPVYDPFCGGGSIPLEAQRLGLEARGSDLNPVAVLITKALIEIPPKFAGQAPVNPRVKKKMPGPWPGASGLADDVRYYGAWMRDRAEERIGHLYPKIGGQTVIAWLWCRTVTCPNPACGAQMPLTSKFALSTKKGKETWVEPVVEGKSVRFTIASGAGKPPDPPKVGRGAKFKCLCCGQIAPDAHIKAEGMAGRMSAQLMAIVAEGDRGRVYLEPDEEHVRIAESAEPKDGPEQQLANDPRNIWCVQYGLRRFRDLFTKRQLVALTTFSDLVGEAREQALADGASPAYADAIATYLSMGVSRLSDMCNAFCTWETSKTQVRHLFTKQAIPMVWDYGEPNVFSNAAGDYGVSLGNLVKALERAPAFGMALAQQLDATAAMLPIAVFSTDPPYYDNIGYADIFDFFYVWLRRSLKNVHPDLFSTLLVPKKQELVATPYRFDGGKEEAQRFFEEGFAKAFASMRKAQHTGYPLTVFYAFKQAEDDEDGEIGQASTGWETMLEGLVRAGFQVSGTWPMRSEMSNRPIASGTNALASSIILVCRPRPETAGVTSRRDFLAALKRELPPALRALQKANIAPVDLAQAAIGPGMAVFSKYAKVAEMDGSAMRVRTALQLINQTLDEVLSEQESDFDADTRFALAWFEQNGFDEGLYGTAEVLATAKAISVSGLVESGIAQSRAGKVRLLKRAELNPDWNPRQDSRLTVWEAAQHLIRALDSGTGAAADLAGQLGGVAETARELAYRLYLLCERKGWAEEAGVYNGLVVSWPEIRAKAEEFTLKA